jgi:hypothetical protein
MGSKAIGSIMSVLLCCSLVNPGLTAAQQATPEPAQANATQQKYKLTILAGASTAKRVKKGRVSSQAVVKVTDENDVPVAGIAVFFTLPQLSGGAAFAGGGMTSLVTTNAVGVASSGVFSATAGSTLSVSVAASVPGGVALTGTVPVSMSAAAAGAAGAAAGGGTAAGAGGGASTGLIVGIAAGAVAAGVGAAVALKGKGGSSSTTTPPPPALSVGSAISITFGGSK